MEGIPCQVYLVNCCQTGFFLNKSTRGGDYAFIDIGNLVTIKGACVRMTSERTRTDDGSIFDLDMVVSLEGNGHAGISLALEVLFKLIILANTV